MGTSKGKRTRVIGRESLERSCMSCSGVGGVGQGAYQYFQTNAGQPSSTQQSADSDSSTDSTISVDVQLQTPSQAQTQAAQPHHHHGGGHHHRGGGVSDLMDTVEQALQSADSSDDPNQVIQDAITKLLSGDGTTGGTAGNGTSSTTTGTAATGQSTDKQSFADFLKSYGVDMQQFRADFLAAAKGGQNGQANPAAALKSFPPGSAVDLTA
jgi:hypothetical protein